MTTEKRLRAYSIGMGVIVVAFLAGGCGVGASGNGWPFETTSENRVDAGSVVADVEPDSNRDEDATAPASGDYAGPVCSDPPEMIWLPEGIPAGRTFRAAGPGPVEPERLWGRNIGERRGLNEKQVSDYLFGIPSSALMLKEVVVTSTGASLVMTAPHRSNATADSSQLNITLFGPDGRLGWRRSFQVNEKLIPEGSNHLRRVGSMTMIRDCRAVVRSAGRMWVLDAQDGAVLNTRKVVSRPLQVDDSKVYEVGLHRWGDGRVVTTTKFRTWGSSDKRLTRLRVVSTPGLETLSTYQGEVASEGYVSPVVRNPGSVKLFMREPRGTDPEPHLAPTLGAVVDSDGGRMRTKWRHKFEYKKNLRIWTERLQIVAATTEQVYVTMPVTGGSRAFVSVRPTDGKVLWSRRTDDYSAQIVGFVRPDFAVGPQGRAVIGYGNGLVGVTKEGRERWVYDLPREGDVEMTMAMGAGGRVYVASLSDEYAIRAFSSGGEQIFKYSLPEGWTYPQILGIGPDRRLYVEALRMSQTDGGDWRAKSRLMVIGDDR